MKYLYTVILLFTQTVLYGQSVVVLDEVTRKPIAEVNIFNTNQGTISSENGIANLLKFNSKDLIKIQHVGYVNQEIIKSLIKDSIYLTPNLYMLETITFEEIKKPLTYQGKLSKANKRQIESLQISSTSELLKKTLGVSVQESQAGGGSPNYRGMEANRLLIVIDGLALNNAIYRGGHIQSSNTINSFFIDNISVVTGPASVVYGDGAMGGALIINTINEKSFNDKYNILEQKYESVNESSSLKYLSKFDSGNFSFINGLAIESNGNIRMGKNRSHGYKNWGAQSEAVSNNEQLNTSYNKYDAIQKIYIKINEKENLSLNSQFSTSSKISRFDKLNDMQDGEKKYKQWYYGPQTRIMQNLNYNKITNSLLADKYSIIMAWQNAKESRHKQKTNDLYISNRRENVLILDGVLDIKKNINKFKLNYGFSYRQQFVESQADLISEDNQVEFNTTRYPDGGSEVTDGSVYAQINWNAFKNTTIFFGERYNMNFLAAKFKNNNIYNLPFSEIKTTNKAFVSSFLISQKISTSVSANIAYYMGYRNPNIDDVGKIFSKNDYSVVIPNNNLKPEQTSNFEYSILINMDRIKFEAQYYSVKIKNAIQRVNSNLNGQDSIIYDGEMMQIQMNQNIESAEISGFNLASEIKFTKSTMLDFKLNYLKGETDLNRPLAHIPPLNSRINLTHIEKNHNLTLSYSYNGWKKAKNYDDNGVDNIEEATTEGNPSWQKIDLIYSIKLAPNIKISLAAENILDVHYKTFGSGISAKGRNFILSLTTNF